MTSSDNNTSQDNFVETRNPAELAMCIILSAAYAGLAKYCYVPLQASGSWRLLINVEGFFATIALLALFIGLRPYFNPCRLQLSNKGIKYAGPYWPQRKTVNWDQVLKLYISPELIVVLYHPHPAKKGIWPLFIQSVYLSDRDQITESIKKYCSTPPIMLTGPSWASRLVIITLFIVMVITILELLIR